MFRARDLDCILVPVVGFDEALHRLGMGGGYYDRALANLNPWKPTTLIGVAHELQKVSELAHNTWALLQNLDYGSEVGVIRREKR